jgi:catechol 2,3-dioxygenase-like lactoylglutathione lyase family enzyme
MKRFHVHVAVADLESSIRFYSSLFGAQPAVAKDDYAKWMLDDPRVNFAISKRGDAPGVNHLGIQVESDEELLEMRGRLSQAEQPVVEQAGAACCYAASNKHWVQDPQGVAWETFHTLSHIPVFGEDTRTSLSRIPVKAATCCIPKLDG